MAAQEFTNLGPIYTTQAKYNALKAAGNLEVGREYKFTDWEAQEKLIAGDNITIADDGKTISAAQPDLSDYAKTSEVTTAVSTAVNNLIDGAPEALNTLKEIADNISILEGKQDALIAGDNITIADDGKTISAASPDLSSYATQEWVTDKGYVDTSTNQDIYGDKLFHAPVGYGTGLNATFVDDKKIRTTGAMAPERIYNLPEDNDLEVTLASRAWVEEQNYLTEHQSLDDYATQEWVAENYSTVALRPMKDEWLGYSRSLTTAQAAEAILADEDTNVGDGFLGAVAWTDFSQLGLGNAEVKAFVISEDIVQFELTSGSTEPYAWFFNSWEGEWRSYVPIADDLTTDNSKYVLSAKQGKALNDNKQDKLVAGTGITIADDGKTISAATSDLTGYATQTWVSENFSNVALKPMKEEWIGSNLTTAQAAEAILNDENTNVGDAFLGSIEWSDLYYSIRLMNAEAKAFVVAEDIVQFEISSSTTAPYAWFYNSWADEWHSYVPLVDNLTTEDAYAALTAKQGKVLNDSKQDKLTAGTGITIENNIISASGGDSSGGTVFLATYESTSFADIKAAYEAGKLLKLKYNPTGNAIYYADLCQVAEFAYDTYGDQGTTFYFSCPKMYWSLSPALFEQQGTYYFAVYRGKSQTSDTWSVKEYTAAVPNATASTVGGIKLYNDTDSNVLYITNDGTDPTPSE